MAEEATVEYLAVTGMLSTRAACREHLPIGLDTIPEA